MKHVDVVVGTLGRAHGLSGEIFVTVTTDSPQERFRPGAFVWADGSRRLTVRSSRDQSSRTVLKFDEVPDRTAAEALTGAQLIAHVDAEETPADPQEFYDHQLVGLKVVTTEGVLAGTVARIDHLGFQDLLAVSTPQGERLVPFVDDLVPEVDLAAGQVVVNPIPGLLKDEE
ncbi:MAG: ribosome maturation factor RimM [Propionibacteriaceae bacterium]|nr:ribosome maturation factor RimM [Propionibacteriaceae bacterium]